MPQPSANMKQDPCAIVLGKRLWSPQNGANARASTVQGFHQWKVLITTEHHFYKYLFKTREFIVVILPTSMRYINILPNKNTGIYGRDQEEKEINFIPFSGFEHKWIHTQYGK